MKEIIIRIRNPHRPSEFIDNKNDLHGLELIIDGQPVYQVKRFAIDIDVGDITCNRGYQDISYTLEKYLNINEIYYDNSDTLKEYDDLLKVKS